MKDSELTDLLIEVCGEQHRAIQEMRHSLGLAAGMISTLGHRSHKQPEDVLEDLMNHGKRLYAETDEAVSLNETVSGSGKDCGSGKCGHKPPGTQ